eukprot:10697006-Heterocapsa_arctica.AAC.1
MRESERLTAQSMIGRKNWPERRAVGPDPRLPVAPSPIKFAEEGRREAAECDGPATTICHCAACRVADGA